MIDQTNRRRFPECFGLQEAGSAAGIGALVASTTNPGEAQDTLRRRAELPEVTKPAATD